MNWNIFFSKYEMKMEWVIGDVNMLFVEYRIYVGPSSDIPFPSEYIMIIVSVLMLQ